jgi:hypothetical protein
VNGTIESQYLERVGNREARYGAAVERGAGRGNLSVHLGDPMIAPAELAVTL